MIDRSRFPFPRLFCDEHFLADLLKDKTRSDEYLKKLKEIHTHPLNYSWEHNYTLDTSFKSVLKSDKEFRKAGVLLASMHPDPYWDAEGLHTSVIKRAIALADKPPFVVFILTSAEEAIKYNKNSHYEKYAGVRSAIFVKYGKSALDIIDRIVSDMRQACNS